MHRITEINDKSLLSEINTIIETKSNSIIYKTTPEQCAKGEFFTNEQVEKEIDQWLNEK